MTAIYLDNNATSVLDPRVRAAMLPWLGENVGNPASVSHEFGRRARVAVEAARATVAELIGVPPGEIVWTSGATESCNLALQCTARAYADRGRHIVTQATEHPAVLDCCAALRREGCEVTVLPVNGDGVVDAAALHAALRPDTVVVSIMAANNETGTLQPLADIAAACRARGVLFHVDAAQALGRVALDAGKLGVDLLSANAHKMHGPPGVGVLCVRGGRATLRGVSLLHGGGHELGLRSGTLNVPAIVGFGVAAELARTALAEEAARTTALRDALHAGLQQGLPGVTLNGHELRRLPNTLNLAFDGIDAETLMNALPHIAVSSGAACTSALRGPSPVLRAMGREPAALYGSIRFSLGRFNTAAEIERVIDDVVRAVRDLRSGSSLD